MVVEARDGESGASGRLSPLHPTRQGFCLWSVRDPKVEHHSDGVCLAAFVELLECVDQRPAVDLHQFLIGHATSQVVPSSLACQSIQAGVGLGDGPGGW